jgi:ABC-2 type transport system permease protein
MFFPRLAEQFGDSEEKPVTGNTKLMLLAGEEAALLEDTLAAALSGYELRVTQDSFEQIEDAILSGEVECAVVLEDLTSYTYYVNNLTMYDTNVVVIDSVLQNVYRMNKMMEGGLSAEAANSILTMPIQHETKNLGKDQIENYFYTYIMIMALYMVILLYGQLVASNVATEKSSRAMELLVTSAKPTAMMFGKVLASCLAGFLQLISIFGSALLCYQLNENYWGSNDIVKSIFNMPVDLFAFMLLFFVLGFLIYAFLFGAVGSTASKLEDINTSVMPITMMFVVAFMVVMFSISSGSVDNIAMQICSFVPFTSPMAMFSRIAMSTVPAWQIAISIAILVVSVLGVGVISAKIYRVGVLLYGTPPKVGAIIKAIRCS